jgi:hypothetical protein
MTQTAAAGRTRQFRLLLSLVVVGLAMYPAWVSRFGLVNDTVSYLDMGDQFFDGHFAMIVNGTWGPLYALLLGAWLHAFRPAPQWEYPSIHLLLFLVFLFCLACFDFFLAALLEFRERQFATDELDDGSGPALTIIGYAIFAWSTLVLVGIQETNPDMLVAAWIFLGCGCTLRLYSSKGGWATIYGLGIAVGAGYLTKAVLLPVGAAMIGAVVFVGPDLRTGFRQALLATLAAGFLSAPYVAALSVHHGTLTVTQTGQYNYAVHVNGVTGRHWQGETRGAGTPLHATRRLLDSPAVFEFGTPLPGTYPYWFDPSYWYEGVKTPFDWTHQKLAALQNARSFIPLLYAMNCAPLSVFILLQSLALSRTRLIRSATKYWIVLLPAVLSLVPYVLIHWETRYLAGGICVLFVTAIASARLHAWPTTRHIYRAAATLVAVLFFLPNGPSSTAGVLGFWQAVQLHWPQSENFYWRAAAALNEAGFPEGTKVATIEFGDMSHMIWARLARVQIVAEVDCPLEGLQAHDPHERQEAMRKFFWYDSPEVQQRMLLALKSSGARALVTAEPPQGPDADQWKQLGRSGYYYRGL